MAGIINTSRITTNKVMKRMEEEDTPQREAATSCGPFRLERLARGEVSSAQAFARKARLSGRRAPVAETMAKIVNQQRMG